MDPHNHYCHAQWYKISNLEKTFKPPKFQIKYLNIKYNVLKNYTKNLQNSLQYIVCFL